MTTFYDQLQTYCEAHSTPPDAVLHELERETHLKTLAPQMMAGPWQGKLLEFLCRIAQPGIALEVGTFTGYAAICLARGLNRNGTLHTIEINRELEGLIRKYFKKAGVSDKIQLHLGDATHIIPKLPDGIGLAFIDAGKQHNELYYEMILKKLKPDGFILIDNVLWSGKVVRQQYSDKDTEMIRAFNKKLMKDTRVENVMLPVRDGLFIIKKK